MWRPTYYVKGILFETKGKGGRYEGVFEKDAEIQLFRRILSFQNL